MREAIPPSARLKILIRDGFRCTYCGATQKDAKIEIDHVIPVSAGGTNEEGNLVAACFACNRGKRDKILVSPVESDAGVYVNRPQKRLVTVPEQAIKASVDCKCLLTAWNAALRTRWQNVQAIPESITISSSGKPFEFSPDFICTGREGCDIGQMVRVIVVDWREIGRLPPEEMLRIMDAVISGYFVPTMILMGPPEFFYGVCITERYKGMPTGCVVDDHLQPIGEWQNTGWYPDEDRTFEDLREPFLDKPWLLAMRSLDNDGNIEGVYSSFFVMEGVHNGL